MISQCCFCMKVQVARVHNNFRVHNHVILMIKLAVGAHRTGPMQMEVMGRPSHLLRIAMKIVNTRQYMVVSSNRYLEEVSKLCVGDKVYVNTVEFKDKDVRRPVLRTPL